MNVYGERGEIEKKIPKKEGNIEMKAEGIKLMLWFVLTSKLDVCSMGTLQ